MGDCAIIEEERMLPMRDGIRLQTFLFRREGMIFGPVLLQRSPYPVNRETDFHAARWMAERGFISVLQYCRGTGGSEGNWQPNDQERPDGIDTLTWLNDQPWVESIGIYGGSYMALTGWAVMDAVPAKVKGMYLMVYGTDRFTSAWQDGLFRQDVLTGWAMQNAGQPVHADYLTSCLYRPQVRVDRDLWGVDLPWYRDWITHPDREDAYWQSGFWKLLREMPEKVHIPIVIEEGWFDHHLGSALAGYQHIPKDRCLLRIGPWNHCRGWALSGIPEQKLEDQLTLILHFFQTLLVEDQETPTGVELYLCGGHEWLRLSGLPLCRETKTLYLHAGDQGTVLTFTLPEPGQIAYDYDPDQPVMTCGAESCLCTWDQVGSKRQPAPGNRADVITFLSERLQTPMTICGAIEVDLYAQTDVEDTAFVVKLSMVDHAGEAWNVRIGATTIAKRIDHRNGVSHLKIRTWDIAWQLPAGSRIRLDVTSSDFPQYCVHPNVGGCWSEQTETRIAHQIIHTGGSYPSAVHLPLLTQEKETCRPQ